MCRSAGAAWRRAADRRGQTTAEYVVITGIIAAVAVLVSNGLGLSLRLALQNAALRVLSVVTGYP
jgi:hypothetical protein